MLGSAMNEFAEVDSLLYLSYDMYKMVVTDLYERYEIIIKPKTVDKEINNLNKELLKCKLETNNVNYIENGLDKESEKGTMNGIKLEEEKAEECEIKLSNKAIEWITKKLNYVERYLRGRNWLVGKQPSIADFFFIEIMNLLEWVDPKDTLKAKLPRVNNLIRKFYLIPEMAVYKKTQDNFDDESINLMLKEL